MKEYKNCSDKSQHQGHVFHTTGVLEQKKICIKAKKLLVFPHETLTKGYYMTTGLLERFIQHASNGCEAVYTTLYHTTEDLLQKSPDLYAAGLGTYATVAWCQDTAFLCGTNPAQAALFVGVALIVHSIMEHMVTNMFPKSGGSTPSSSSSSPPKSDPKALGDYYRTAIVHTNALAFTGFMFRNMIGFPQAAALTLGAHVCLWLWTAMRV
jgi:hypothetical protein